MFTAQDSLTYAGIGARITPKHILAVMTRYSYYAAMRGHKLNTGGAKGPDQACEKGHCAHTSKGIQIFVAEARYPYLETDPRVMVGAKKDAREIAEKYYNQGPSRRRYADLTDYAQTLMARNGYQVLGKDLESPVDYIFCWTPGGEIVGGTGQALLIAKGNGIKIENLGNPETLRRIKAILDKANVVLPNENDKISIKIP